MKELVKVKGWLRNRPLASFWVRLRENGHMTHFTGQKSMSANLLDHLIDRLKKIDVVKIFVYVICIVIGLAFAWWVSLETLRDRRVKDSQMLEMVEYAESKEH